MKTPDTALPLRARPLSAVDAYVISSPWEITACKTIRGDEPYLEGHYPDFTIFPGVFSIEAFVQTVRLVTAHSTSGRSEPELETMRSVRFSVPLLPGDTLSVHCVCTRKDGDLLRAKATCSNNRGERTATMTADFRLIERETAETESKVGADA